MVYPSGNHRPSIRGVNSSDSTRVFQGFSGGMMLHTGYLFGQDQRAPHGVSGDLYSPEGATIGIGGAMHVHLWRLLRVGCEGSVSTMYSSMTNCRHLLERGSYVRTGWGGINVDACWRDLPEVGHTQLWPYVGAAVGGGAMRSFYLMEGNQNDWLDEQRTLFHKEPFVYLCPYLGMYISLTSRVHLTLRLDWLLAFRTQDPQSPIINPTGPRLYMGFMFSH